MKNPKIELGNGFDTLGRVVASYTRDPQFKSHCWQKFTLRDQLYRKVKIKVEDAGKGLSSYNDKLETPDKFMLK